MPGVQFGQQIDMNGLKITELAAGTDPTDAVNVSQLSATVDGFTATIGDGVATTFNINHGLNLTTMNDFVARVAEVSSGAEYLAEVTGVDVDNATVSFGFVPAAGQFRVAILPVR